MNFSRRKNQYIYNNLNFQRKKKNKKDDDNQNEYNQKILDSILDDDDEKFVELVTQIGDIDQINKTFSMTNYKMPSILRDDPPYSLLCAFFKAEKCYNALSLLFPEGLDSEQIKKTDNYGRGPIHFACAGGNLNIIRELEQFNYSLNDPDNEGCLPSHYAAMTGNLDVLKYLWIKAADLMSMSLYNHMTPLHVAALYGHLNIVQFICETVITNKDEKKDDQPFHKKYCKYSTPLHLACEGGHEDVLKYLLTRKELSDFQINSLDNHSRTPLIVACKNGSIGCVKVLVETGKVLNKSKNRKHYPLIDAAAGGFLDIVSFLLKQKEVDIYQIDSKKLDALTASIINNHQNVVKYLIENNALKNYTENKLGDLFLCGCGTNDVSMIAYLDSCFKVPYDQKSNNKVFRWARSASLKMDENTKWGTQYMQQACILENEEMVTFLLSKNITFEGVDFSMNTAKKWSPFLDFLIKKGINLSESLNSDGIPPIVATVKAGSLNNVKKMIKKGAKLDADIISKFDLILSSCSNVKTDLFDFLMSYNPKILKPEECVDRCICGYVRTNLDKRLYIAEEILKKSDCDVNKSYTNYSNETLVSRAVDLRSIEFLNLFVKYGADFSKVPLRFDQLSLKRDIQIIDFLEKHGCKFNTIVTYCYNYNLLHENMNTPLTQSFYLISSYDYNPDFPSLLIDYISENELNDIKEGREEVIDNLMKCLCYDGILKIYKKCNKVIYPKTDKNEFIEWIKESNNKELIDLVLNDNN